jgi:hypothetical protein
VNEQELGWMPLLARPRLDPIEQVGGHAVAAEVGDVDIEDKARWSRPAKTAPRASAIQRLEPAAQRPAPTGAAR